MRNELERLFAQIDASGNSVYLAAKNVAWVHDTLQTLVDNPRLLENREFLIGTLRSLIQSLDADNNPLMSALKIKKVVL